MTDFPDWQDPVAIADQIAINGVGLLRNELAITSGATANLAAGAQTTIGPFTLNSTSYEVRVTLTADALTAICDGQIEIKWNDSADANQLAQKSFSAVASTGGHAITITGPIRGSKLRITFRNSSISLANVTFTYALVASSRLAANDLFRTVTGVGVGPPNLGGWSGLNMDTGILGNGSPSVPAATIVSRGLAAYNGPCQLCVVTQSGVNDAVVNVSIFDTELVTATGQVFRQQVDGQGNLNALFNMPMAECTLNLLNNNAAAKTISFIMTTAEPNVN